jgi:hypothetical protein
MSDFVASLDLEIDRLARAIEDIPEVRKLRELQRVRALYVEESKAPTRLGVASGYMQPRPSAGRKMSPERQRALDFLAVYLGEQTNPIKTTTILEALAGNGISIGGNDPVNSLSALLSTSDKFVAHGRSGWTLTPSRGVDVLASVPAQAGNGNPGAMNAGADYPGIVPSGEKGGGT